MKLLEKHSFWNLVIQSGQILLGSFQGITLAVPTAEINHTVNVVIAFIQGFLGVMALWTADKNLNNKIDILEDDDPVTTTITTSVTSKGPAEIKVEKKEDIPPGK